MSNFSTPENDKNKKVRLRCFTRLSSSAGQIQQPVKQGLGFSRAPRIAASSSFLLILVILVQLCSNKWNLFD